MVSWSALREYIPSGMDGHYGSVVEGKEIQIALGVGGSLLLILALAKYLSRKKKAYPPGPKGAFLLGNLAQIDPTAPYKTLTSWVLDHGDVYSISMLGQRNVVVSGFEAIYEALVTRSDDFMARPYIFRALYFTNFHGGLVFGEANQKWMRMKKLVANSMKMYGDGRGRLEDITTDIITSLAEQLKAKKGEPVDLAVPLRYAMANIISSIIYAKKLDEDRLQALMDVEMPSAEMLSPTGPGSELDVMPFLRYLPTKFYRRMADIQRKIWEWFENERMERQAMRSTGEEECVMDALLNAQEQDASEGSPNPLTDGDITAASIDLIFAGTTTSSSFLLTLIALMVNMPDFQDKLRAEITKRLGKRAPTLADREKMPYTEAAILECLRYMSPTPVPAPHATTKDTTLGGHPIPKNTMVMFNLWHLHHDEGFWEDPWVFRPERFLDASGQLLAPGQGNRKRLLAFAAGRRVCVGESMAKNRLFLFVTSLVQKFRFLPDEGSSPPDSDPRDFVSGIIICPKPYNVKLDPIA